MVGAAIPSLTSPRDAVAGVMVMGTGVLLIGADFNFVPMKGAPDTTGINKFNKMNHTVAVLIHTSKKVACMFYRVHTGKYE